ncbi:unnamed protein product [Mytilus coruscus]|uniref:Poly [ADP-ribose] polymerase n=1 Tax=Mytilus coruscus TaxID=42192 RepID=A0A6J8AZT5_MYTCO|nr:unnamed protein product [Mytilus coruscus]
MVTLDKRTDEYGYVKRDFLNKNSGFKIIQISRIQNKRLYDAHLDFEKNFMVDPRKQHPYSYRKYLWHGTTRESCDIISRYGFDRARGGKNACTFGDGVYFATEPSYASRDGYSVMDASGAKYVFKCSVFVGTYAKGEKGMKEPPTQMGVRYNSTVNNIDNPNQYVAFYDNQAYPQYLIKFERIYLQIRPRL